MSGEVAYGYIVNLPRNTPVDYYFVNFLYIASLKESTNSLNLDHTFPNLYAELKSRRHIGHFNASGFNQNPHQTFFSRALTPTMSPFSCLSPRDLYLTAKREKILQTLGHTVPIQESYGILPAKSLQNAGYESYETVSLPPKVQARIASDVHLATRWKRSTFCISYSSSSLISFCLVSCSFQIYGYVPIPFYLSSFYLAFSQCLYRAESTLKSSPSSFITSFS